MDILAVVAKGSLIGALILFFAFAVGWVLSRGWHRGKRQFVDGLIRDCQQPEEPLGGKHKGD